MAKRFIMRIELTEAAKQQVVGLHNHHGMTQVAMMSELIEYFSEQRPMMQSVMVDGYPAEIRTEVAKLILQRIK